MSGHNERTFDEEELVDLTQFPDRIGETFDGKTLFVTGATGFVGKAIIEKILHNSEVKKIYMLIKSKRGQDAAARFAKYFDSPMFDVLKKDRGVEILHKLAVIAGDVSQLDLGISREDRLKLIEEVDIIYHSAASVRFDDPLKQIILGNVRGTRYMIALAKELKHLQLFVHISTTFCLPEGEVVPEEPIAVPFDPHEIIRIAENVDDGILKILTPKLIKKYPNTYGFSKSLSEAIIYEQMDTLPVMIIRPSIVMPACKSPSPGFTDSVNGPIALWIAIGKGVLRVSRTPRHVKAQSIPLDMVINTILITSHNYIHDTDCKVMVCNATNMPMSMSDWEREFMPVMDECSFDSGFWHSSWTTTPCYFLYYMLFLILQLIPSILIDLVLPLFGRKRMMVGIQQKMFRTLDIIHCYSRAEWHFQNDVIRHLRMDLNPREDEIYALNIDEVDYFKYCYDMIYSGRKLILHEKEEDIPLAILRRKQLYWLHTVVKGMFGLYCVRFAYVTVLPLLVRFAYHLFDV